MSSPRLRAQFETLFEHFNGEDSDTRIEDITEILFCTVVMPELYSTN